MSFSDNFTPYDLPIFTEGMRLPEINVLPDKKRELGLKEDCSNFEYLKKIAWVGCLDKISKGKIKQAKEECIARLKEEFDVLFKTGVTDYFLFLRDILLWCDDNSIPRGPSRGSVGGCFTAFCIDLIYINPLDYDLTFSRFLSEARAKPVYREGVMYVDGKSFCDIDCDLGQRDRGRVLDEVARRYPGKTSKILTLQELTGKMAIKDTAKSYLEYEESEALELSGYFESVFGKVDSIDKTLEKNKEFKEWAEKSPENTEVVRISKKLEGLFRTHNGGIHASGTLCCYYPLEEVVPLEIAEKGIISGFDMNTALSVSIKIDFLGILTLDLLKKCGELTGVKYRDIDVNDLSIYRFFQDSDLFYGLFQISDGITKDVVTKVKPKNIIQLNSCLCIGRPGSIKEIPKFLKWLEKGEKQKIHPEIDEILKDTGGLILFQEDINRICQKVYKMSAVDADSIRAAIGKKRREEIIKWEPIIKQKGIENGIPEEATNTFWSVTNASADYLFSKNHSQAYSYITAYTTYYKANFPKEYYLACLQLAQFEQNPIQCVQDIQGELQKVGLKILPPDILKSSEDFTMEDQGARMGLSAIKGLSGAALEKIKSFKALVDSKFSLFLSLQNSKIPLNVITSLFLAGAFDSVKGDISRNSLLLQFEIWNELTPRELPLINNLGLKFNYDLIEILKKASTELKDEKGKPIIKESRLETLRTKTKPFLLKFRHNERFPELTSYLAENYYLGFSYSHTLKSIYSKHIIGLQDLKTLKTLPQGDYKTVVQITEIEKRTSKNKKDYIKYTVKDDTDSLTPMLFNLDMFEEVAKLKEGSIVVMHLSKKVKGEDSIYFVSDVVEQEVPTVLKVSTIRKELEEKGSNSI